MHRMNAMVRGPNRQRNMAIMMVGLGFTSFGWKSNNVMSGGPSSSMEGQDNWYLKSLLISSMFSLPSIASSQISSMLSSFRMYDASVTTMVTLNHCQVPCGIFDDPATVQKLKQNCATIRKSMVESNRLHSDYVDTTPLNANQFVRWVMTKEQHADDVISTVSEYCLCQRVKRAAFQSEEDYLQALKVHHKVLQAAMKAKQSMDLEVCEALEHAVSDMSKLYVK